MELPIEIFFDQIFTHGGVFRAELEEKSKFRHYFILNINPQSDSVILLAETTTQVQHHRSKFPSEVLVEITPDEYKYLSHNSIINTNIARVENKNVLKQKLGSAYQKGKLQVLEPLPDNIFQKVLKALSFSQTIAPIDKKLALGDE